MIKNQMNIRNMCNKVVVFRRVSVHNTQTQSLCVVVVKSCCDAFDFQKADLKLGFTSFSLSFSLLSLFLFSFAFVFFLVYAFPASTHTSTHAYSYSTTQLFISCSLTNTGFKQLKYTLKRLYCFCDHGFFCCQE